MKLPQLGPRLRIGLQLGASAALLALLISRLEWQRSLALIRGADALLLMLVVAIQSADRLLMALKWHQLLRVLDDRFGRAAAIRVYYESTFVGFALPLGGLGPDIVRFVRLRSRGLSSHVTLASIVMERIIGAVATLTLIVVGLAVLAQLAPQPALRGFARLAAIVAAGAVAAAVAMIFAPAVARGVIGRFRLATSLVTARFAKYVEAARTYSTRNLTLAINLGLSLIEQTAPVFTLWIVSYALHTPLPWIVCLAVTPVAIVIQRLPLTYAGLGLREGSAAALLVALGYDYSAALLLFMMLFVMFCISLLPGAIMLVRSKPQPL